jgi:hypothetical protein
VSHEYEENTGLTFEHKLYIPDPASAVIMIGEENETIVQASFS